MFSFGILAILGGVQAVLLPLFCFTPINHGGLGFRPTDIGNAMSIRAIAVLAIQLLVFPPVQRRLDTLRLYRFSMMLWIPVFMGYPLLNLLARGGYTSAVWFGLAIILLLSAIAGMAFGPSSHDHLSRTCADMPIVCVLLMVNDAAPNRRLLGTINGYSQSIQAVVRIFGPGGASMLFAVSTDKHLLGGNLIWLVCEVVAVLGVISGFLL